MAQGKLKTKKTSIPNHARNKKKQRIQRQKASQLKKGSRFIAPKKTHKLEAASLKRNLQKNINIAIEGEMAARATSHGGQSLKIVNTPRPISKNAKKK